MHVSVNLKTGPHSTCTAALMQARPRGCIHNEWQTPRWKRTAVSNDATTPCWAEEATRASRWRRCRAPSWRERLKAVAVDSLPCVLLEQAKLCARSARMSTPSTAARLSATHGTPNHKPQRFARLACSSDLRSRRSAPAVRTRTAVQSAASSRSSVGISYAAPACSGWRR